MKLLFRREQTEGGLRKVQFKLWAKIELEPDEQEIIKRYRFGDAIMIDAFQPKLLRNCGLIGLAAFIVAFIVLYSALSTTLALVAMSP